LSVGIVPGSDRTGAGNHDLAPADPTVAVEIRRLIREMSISNPLWGAPRIHGELLKLGIEIGQTCACRKLNPGISVMESAQDWATKIMPGAIYGARDRCIFLQG
jgi:hypothetical protein